MSTQARLPGTLPSPAKARSNLRDAREALRLRRLDHDRQKEHVKRAKDGLDAAGKALDLAEDDLCAAADGSPEETSADAKHDETLRAVDRAEKDLVKVQAALQLAADELTLARRQLGNAREDMRAIREGRRKR